MAEPTLKDVLNAIAKLDAKIDKVDAKVDAHRAETKAGFAALDDELEKHALRAHRDLDARIGRLEKRTAPKKVSVRPLRRR